MVDPLAADTGFLARFLICGPSSTIGTRLHAKSRKDDMAISVFGSRLQTILQTELLIDEKTRELHPRLLRLGEEAKDLPIPFPDTIEAGQAKGRSLEQITGTASKKSMALRTDKFKISLIFFPLYRISSVC